MASDAMGPGKGGKQEVKVHMDQKEEKGKKKSSLPASLAPGITLPLSYLYL